MWSIIVVKVFPFFQFLIKKLGIVNYYNLLSYSAAAILPTISNPPPEIGPGIMLE